MASHKKSGLLILLSLILFPKTTAILFTDTKHNSCANRRNRKYWRDTFKKVNYLFLFMKNLSFSLPKASKKVQKVTLRESKKLKQFVPFRQKPFCSLMLLQFLPFTLRIFHSLKTTTREKEHFLLLLRHQYGPYTRKVLSLPRNRNSTGPLSAKLLAEHYDTQIKEQPVL